MNKKENAEQKNESTKVPLRVILWMISVRIIIIPLLNYDYPDEYWQGPQIAYKIYNRLINRTNLGYETWEWTIEDPIRNPVYQFFLSLGYMGAHFLINVIRQIQQNYQYLLGFHEKIFDMMMEYSPKVVQLCLAILGDAYVVKLLYFYFGKQKVTIWSILFVLSNWFYLSMLSRTFINSFECALMSLAFYYWQVHYFQNVARAKTDHKVRLLSQCLVLIAYVARPTSLIPWMIIWPFQLLSYLHQGPILKLLAKNIFQIITMLSSSILIGSMYFNKFVFTEWNFLYYNLVLKWADTFGIHPWYFYLVFTLPLIFAGYLLLMIIGFGIFIAKKNFVLDQIDNLKNQQFSNLCWMTLLFLAITTMVSGHKEHRFLMIYIPFFLVIIFAGYIQLRQLLWTYRSKSILIKKICFIAIILVILVVNIWILATVAFYPKGGFDLLREVRLRIDLKEKRQLSTTVKNKIGLMYLSDAHTLPAFSLILRDVLLMLPDDSPIAKFQNRSEIQMLKNSPEATYNKLKANFEQNKLQFIVLQQKYCRHDWVDDVQSQLKRLQYIRKGIIHPYDHIVIEEKCKFVLKDYKRIMTSNNRNFWEEGMFGNDFLFLYVRKQSNQQQYLVK